MTTFTMQDLNNNIPVTKEEEEAMDALSRLGAGVPLPTKEEWVNYGVENCTPPTPQQSQLDPQKIIDEMVAQFSLSLKLLTSVISQNQGNSHEGEAGEKSLQECVSTTLQQAEWFKQALGDQVDALIEERDFAYEINSEVEDWFSNSFSLDDHVDIEAEVESKLEDIVERIVEDRLAEVVEEKLRSANISISF